MPYKQKQKNREAEQKAKKYKHLQKYKDLPAHWKDPSKQNNFHNPLSKAKCKAMSEAEEQHPSSENGIDAFEGMGKYDFEGDFDAEMALQSGDFEPTSLPPPSSYIVAAASSSTAEGPGQWSNPPALSGGKRRQSVAEAQSDLSSHQDDLALLRKPYKHLTASERSERTKQLDKLQSQGRFVMQEDRQQKFIQQQMQRHCVLTSATASSSAAAAASSSATPMPAGGFSYGHAGVSAVQSINPSIQEKELAPTLAPNYDIVYDLHKDVEKSDFLRDMIYWTCRGQCFPDELPGESDSINDPMTGKRIARQHSSFLKPEHVKNWVKGSNPSPFNVDKCYRCLFGGPQEQSFITQLFGESLKFDSVSSAEIALEWSIKLPDYEPKWFLSRNFPTIFASVATNALAHVAIDLRVNMVKLLLQDRWYENGVDDVETTRKQYINTKIDTTYGSTVLHKVVNPLSRVTVNKSAGDIILVGEI